MIDIHSHILPGIDDGANSIEESIEILKQASRNNVKEIILTPHYILGSDYNSRYKDNINLLNELKDTLKKENIDINLYLGNEVFVENNMIDLINNEDITTLNNTRYLLFELPLNNTYNGLNDLLFELNIKGYKPIIAHPERYSFLKENPSLIEELVDKGALFQSNIGSFLGMYGKKTQDLAFLLLRHNVISFIGSDIHSKNHTFYDKIEECKELMRKYITEKEINNIFLNNAEALLNDRELKSKEYIPFKKNIFGKWK